MRKSTTQLLVASSAMTLAGGRGLLGGMTPAERRMGRFMRDPDDHPTPVLTPEKAMEQIKGDLAKTTDSIKEIAEQALAEAKKGVTATDGFKEKADELLTKFNELGEKFADLEQRSTRENSPEPVKSLGDQFTEGEAFKSLLEKAGQRGTANMEIKATITSATTNAAGSAGAAVRAERLEGILPLAQRKMFIQDLIAPGQMSGQSLEYVRQTGFTNGAGMVAEGAAKPGSDIQLELVTTGAKVIAHHMKASRQIMDDAPQLRSLIDNNLLYGLKFKKEQQILTGDGTGQNLLGIIPQATAFVAPAGAPAADHLIDTLRLAMLQAVLAEYPASAHVLNPIDWARIELLKDDYGRYIIGQPQGNAVPRMWGLPVVETQFIAVDKFLTGAFSLGAQYFDRWLARIQLATENEDDFVKNLVTLLAEERGALAVYRPEAFIYGDFGNVA